MLTFKTERSPDGSELHSALHSDRVAFLLQSHDPIIGKKNLRFKSSTTTIFKNIQCPLIQSIVRSGIRLWESQKLRKNTSYEISGFTLSKLDTEKSNNQ